MNSLKLFSHIQTSSSGAPQKHSSDNRSRAKYGNLEVRLDGNYREAETKQKRKTKTQHAVGNMTLRRRVNKKTGQGVEMNGRAAKHPRSKA